MLEELKAKVHQRREEGGRGGEGGGEKERERDPSENEAGGVGGGMGGGGGGELYGVSAAAALTGGKVPLRIYAMVIFFYRKLLFTWEIVILKVPLRIHAMVKIFFA